MTFFCGNKEEEAAIRPEIVENRLFLWRITASS
jgi:hypothetical protein